MLFTGWIQIPGSPPLHYHGINANIGSNGIGPKSETYPRNVDLTISPGKVLRDEYEEQYSSHRKFYYSILGNPGTNPTDGSKHYALRGENGLKNADLEVNDSKGIIILKIKPSGPIFERSIQWRIQNKQ
jgi:hypothetical protein